MAPEYPGPSVQRASICAQCHADPLAATVHQNRLETEVGTMGQAGTELLQLRNSSWNPIGSLFDLVISVVFLHYSIFCTNPVMRPHPHSTLHSTHVLPPQWKNTGVRDPTQKTCDLFGLRWERGACAHPNQNFGCSNPSLPNKTLTGGRKCGVSQGVRATAQVGGGRWVSCGAKHSNDASDTTPSFLAFLLWCLADSRGHLIRESHQMVTVPCNLRSRRTV